ncbi:MAG TPA: 3-oxoacyl-[acyl-carrier-protein] reductase [Planctomycetaceae bacterium]|nr:3-oxoacyl-[acyl-carrier-protein] reductase [Planctomycetaceae bacterium]
MKLDGRVAIVTGGSRGIGRAIVCALAREGAKVAFAYHSNQQAADELAAELKREGREVVAFQCDVKQKSAADELVEAVLAKWEKIDILVNNAGVIRDTLLATMSEEHWNEVIATNLNGVFHFCQAVTRPMMSQRYGRMINVSSVAADFGNPGQSNYAASKGGVDGFTRCVAAELAKRNITVNAVAPGFIETDMTIAVRSAAGDQIVKHIPARRLGKPEDVAHAVVFLASEESAYITGQVLRVDGGLTLGGF